MIINPSLPNGQITFCDDIRQEVNGKLSLMGVYANELVIFGEPPVALQQLCALVTYHFDPSNLPQSLVARVVFEGASGEEVVLVDAIDELPEVQHAPKLPTLNTSEPNAQAYARIVRIVRLEQPTFPEPGRLKVRFYLGDDEIRVGSLRVSFAPAPGAQAPEEETPA